MTAPPDAAWLPAVTRWLDRPAVVTGRETLTGGYVADAVTRVDLAGAPAVVVKQAKAGEVAAMRALAVVPGVERPRLLAAGPDWLVVPYYDGPPLVEGPYVPHDLWMTLARVHVHWLGKRPRGLPVVDPTWWRALCLDRILPHVHAAGKRTGDQVFADAATALRGWATDARVLAALAVLPATLVHGDPHRGNILMTLSGAVLIDWGNARVGPAWQDLAVLRAQGATDDSAYRQALIALAGCEPRAELVAVERHCADVWANVGYLGFAADHLGAARVAELLNVATLALDALGPALASVRSYSPNGTSAS
ncbi:MAG: phosphotransferase [Pseudonocardia sp.]